MAAPNGIGRIPAPEDVVNSIGEAPTVKKLLKPDLKTERSSPHTQ